jgi:GNAT superfamily N-acetyltransferase
MEPGESTYVLTNEPPATTQLACQGPFGVVQMEWPKDLAPPSVTEKTSQIVPLTCENAAEMVALTDIAFPGFFRPETCRMGPYFGIRSDSGELIAMCGERLNIGDFHELSGLCTHPDHRGKGYAQLLMSKLMRDHRAAGLGSYLHASSNNRNAIDIYLRMGFILRGEFPLYLVNRKA